MTAKKPAGRIDWPAVRAAWEGERKANDTSIARRFGVDRTTVMRRRQRERWRKIPDDVVRQAVKRHLDETGSNADLEVAAKAVDEEARRRASVIERHRGEWVRVQVIQQHAVKLKRQAKADGTGEEWIVDKADFEMCKVAKITAETLEIKQRAERKAHAIDDPDQLTPATVVRPKWVDVSDREIPGTEIPEKPKREGDK